ncbi:MAG TPA: flagellar export chaperone FliS [Pirellulales bacterium]
MMYNRPSEKYFADQVLTASPQRLQLMSLDGALQYARRAIQHWEAGKIYEGGEALIGCQQIVAELLRGLRPEQAPELVAQVTALYHFVFRTLVEAASQRSVSKLNEAIAVLEIERETWRQVCERLGSALEAPAPSAAPRAPHFMPAHDAPAERFSIDA